MTIRKNCKKTLIGIVLFAALSLLAHAQDGGVIALGKAVGIKIFSEGCYVTNFQEINTRDGKMLPARDCKLQKGDQILMADDKEITGNTDLKNAIENTENEQITLKIKRGEDEMLITVTPVQCSDTGKRRIGAYVRDSMAGIGTVTFVNPETDEYAALGHGISDADTKGRVSVDTGAVMNVYITDIVKSVPGKVGELKGKFVGNDIGTVSQNRADGIYGRIKLKDEESFTTIDANSGAAKEGKASIFSNIEGNLVEEFSITIDKINRGSTERNFHITVTDPRLLEKTGGIVQGMSGSPIVQDGILVGAVTHVLVSDPSKGFGIFVEKMI